VSGDNLLHFAHEHVDTVCALIDLGLGMPELQAKGHSFMAAFSHILVGSVNRISEQRFVLFKKLLEVGVTIGLHDTRQDLMRWTGESSGGSSVIYPEEIPMMPKLFLSYGAGINQIVNALQGVDVTGCILIGAHIRIDRRETRLVTEETYPHAITTPKQFKKLFMENPENFTMGQLCAYVRYCAPRAFEALEAAPIEELREAEEMEVFGRRFLPEAPAAPAAPAAPPEALVEYETSPMVNEFFLLLLACIAHKISLISSVDQLIEFRKSIPVLMAVLDKHCDPVQRQDIIDKN
jgi:hypothetical protein